MINGLLLGVILAVFGFDDVVITSMRELFGITITTASYYFIFAILGLLSSITIIRC